MNETPLFSSKMLHATELYFYKGMFKTLPSNDLTARAIHFPILLTEKNLIAYHFPTVSLRVTIKSI